MNKYWYRIAEAKLIKSCTINTIQYIPIVRLHTQQTGAGRFPSLERVVTEAD